MSKRAFLIERGARKSNRAICQINGCSNPAAGRTGHCRQCQKYLNRCEKTIIPYREAMRVFCGIKESGSSRDKKARALRRMEEEQ